MPEHLLADLIGHEIDIIARCGCTKITVFYAASLVRQLGQGATLERAEARLRCKVCHERPRLTIGRTWATSGGRDRRVDPPALPEWVSSVLVR